MTAYLVLFAAVFSRLLPHLTHSSGIGFTAVGGGLLYFGARRSRWHAVVAALALMATDYYLTVYAYGYPFHATHYLPTWAWYAGVCLMANATLAKKQSFLRVTGAVLASATSFFVISNFFVWAWSHLYAKTVGGLMACYVAGIPFYRNDLIATGMIAGVLFGLPVLVRQMTAAHEAANDSRMAH
ncbi:DUF6580 family putative transport protein [Terriglobus tenax]|uniref:DUF6580 family putative transport protein n=1 Tax=Terriglobus tenax TaxID=1111115 RepID=UPI0021DFC123|nr:DUF6580 family putative transport protein [Terriglobus tenax]